MPVLMVALLALSAFAAIGLLLAAAVIMETREKKQKQEHSAPPFVGRHLTH